MSPATIFALVSLLIIIGIIWWLVRYGPAIVEGESK